MAKNSIFSVPKSDTGIYTIPVGVGGGGGTIGAVGGTGGSGIVKSRMIADHEITGQTVVVEHTYPGDVGDGRYTEDHIKKLLM